MQLLTQLLLLRDIDDEPFDVGGVPLSSLSETLPRSSIQRMDPVRHHQPVLSLVRFIRDAGACDFLEIARHVVWDDRT
jgi:hypothetical protein